MTQWSSRIKTAIVFVFAEIPTVEVPKAVGPGYPWQLVSGGEFLENFTLQLVSLGPSAEKGGPSFKFLMLHLV